MKKHMLLILFIFCFGTNSGAQIVNTIDSLDRDKIRNDSLFINKLAEVYNNHPADILPLFDNCNRKAVDLGFDYYSVEGFYGFDDTSNLFIGYQFIFQGEKLIAYQLTAGLTARQYLVDIYKRFYSVLFKFNSEDKANPIYYNYMAMIKSIAKNKKLKVTTDDKQIGFLMTPFSGIIYGQSMDEFTGYKMRNRTLFDAIKNKVTPDIEYMLLNSINPATRLSAIEYYYRRPELFRKNSGLIEARIKYIYKDTPIVTTIVGNSYMNQKAEELVRIYANKR